MSERVTKDWSNTFMEAFGASPQAKHGKEIEDMYFAYAKKVYSEVENHESDQEKQNQGIDFTIYKKKWGPTGYTVQVKSNKSQKEVEIDNTPKGWLRNPKFISDRIVLVHKKSGWAVDFRRKDMIDFIDNWTNIPKEQEVVGIPIFKEGLPKNLLHNHNLLKHRNSIDNFIVKNPNQETVEA